MGNRKNAIAVPSLYIRVSEKHVKTHENITLIKNNKDKTFYF